jgi:hypothetical protein
MKEPAGRRKPKARRLPPDLERGAIALRSLADGALTALALRSKDWSGERNLFLTAYSEFDARLRAAGSSMPADLVSTRNTVQVAALPKVPIEAEGEYELELALRAFDRAVWR